LEDHDPDVWLITAAFRSHGFIIDLVRCRNGEEALQVAASAQLDDPFRLVILDLNVPRVDGFQVLKHLRTMPSFANVPIAMLTSSASEEDRKRVLASGANSFVTKPYDLNGFLSIVGAELQKFLGNGTGSAARPA
jgi:DNA-binding response OmpR family regulator